MTIGELYGPAMSITNQDRANEYLAYIVKQIRDLDPNLTVEAAEQMARENLGYYAGYYSNETRAQVERVFGCQHPIFGAIAECGAPTPEQASEMGLARGRANGRAVRAVKDKE